MYKRLKWMLAIVSLGIILVGCQMNSEQKSQRKMKPKLANTSQIKK
ncbi:lipoprotein BUG3 [Streptococcus iniae SF1]|nr:lipoprotein BUG3 [Streptococcus iniae SF1]